MAIRAAIYLRVSTDEQAEFGYSIQSQQRAAQSYAEQNGLTVEKTITDDGYSGSTLNRPGLDELRELINDRQIDAIIAFSPDRLTRNLAHSLLLREEWKKANIELHYYQGGKVEDTPDAKMQQNIQAVFADYWRVKIVEGSRRGRLAKAAAGKWPGDGHAAYGYRKKGKARDTHLAINEREAEIVQRIFAMYVGQGTGKPLGLRSIAAVLTTEGIPPPNRGRSAKRDGSNKGKGWHKSTVRRITMQKKYTGEFEYGGHQIKLPELAIISQSLFEKAQKRRKGSRAVMFKKRKYDALLAGHVKCTCGRNLSADSMGGGKYIYYTCNSKINAPYLKSCSEKRIRANGESGADTLVWAWLHSLLTDETRLEKGLRALQKQRLSETEDKRSRLETLDSLISKTKKAVNQLASKYAQEQNEFVAEALYRELKANGAALEALTVERERIGAELLGQNITDADVQAIKEMAQQVRGELSNAPFELQRQIMSVLDVRVELIWLDAERGLKCTCNLTLNTTSNGKLSLTWTKPLNLGAKFLSTMMMSHLLSL